MIAPAVAPLIGGALGQVWFRPLAMLLLADEV